MPIPTPLYFPPAEPTTGRGPLHSGSTWEGVQRSGRSSFGVKVSIDQVDYKKGTCCGLLTISGLTPQLDNLTTFFEGEIVTADGFGFKTGRYGATEADDLKHWSRFHHFRNSKPNLKGENWNYSSDDKPAVFMRWKEKFVIPNGHSGKEDRIHGASYSGFYYLCLSLPDEPFAPPPPRSPFPRRPSFDAATLHPTPRLSSNPPWRQPAPPQPAQFAASLLTNPFGIEERPEEEREGRPGRPPPAPLVNRRSSSYAEAVRTGAPSPPTVPGTPATEMPSTPKEIDCEAQLALATSSDSPFVTGSAGSSSSVERLLASSPGAGSTASSLFDSLSPPRVNLPTPFGLSADDFPAPTSPSPSRPAGLYRARSSSMSATRDDAASPSPKFDRKRDQKPDYGLKSWSRAEIRGFYFFRCSEPFQELTLKYVPQARGGSESYDFR